MIKRKFNLWEQFFKNFSVTYIGYGKFLYYHRNPRNKKIRYGKIDLNNRKLRLVFSSLISSLIILSFIYHSMLGEPAPAVPSKLNSLDQLEGTFPREDRFEKRGSKASLTQLNSLNSIEELNKLSQGSLSALILEESAKILSMHREAIDSLAKKKLDLSNFKKGETNSENIPTTIDDDITQQIKASTMLSDDTKFIPESESSKVKIYHYKVRPGDNVGLLARKFGVSSQTIGGSSKKIHNMDEIWVGLKLTIPSQDGILYKVKKGETLAMVANRFKVPLAKILRVNDFDNPDDIPIGNYIFLPDVKPKNLFRAFLWPVRGRITSGFGWRRHPFIRKWHFHDGLDIGVRYTKVRASKSGRVTYAGWMGGYGKVVILSHPGNYKTLYAHNSRLYVRKGQYVRQGQWISRSGNTGRSTGPHVHFEVWKNNRQINPLKVLRKKR